LDINQLSLDINQIINFHFGLTKQEFVQSQPVKIKKIASIGSMLEEWAAVEIALEDEKLRLTCMVY